MNNKPTRSQMSQQRDIVCEYNEKVEGRIMKDNFL